MDKEATIDWQIDELGKYGRFIIMHESYEMHENYESNDMLTSSLSVKASGVTLLDRLVAVTVSQSEMILLTR
jgi:hypothetical protein